jgi:predicted nucleic acid-binding Zn ribbon protein
MKKCLECEEAIRGREDKRFCSDNCRSAYNNRLNAESNKLIRNTNNILKRNRRILLKFNPKGKAKIHKDKLLEAGFKFNYLTSFFITKAGKEYRFVYDQGYLELDNGYYALVVRKGYVD